MTEHRQPQDFQRGRIATGGIEFSFDFGIGHFADDLMSGSNVGLALFSSDLELLTANGRYARLCGYDWDDLVPGTSLEWLMRVSLLDAGKTETEVEQIVTHELARLCGPVSHTFTHTRSDGESVEITRRRLLNGRVVETVLEKRGIAPVESEDDQLFKLAETARSRMVHALDVMADGFALYDSDDRLVAYNRKYIELNPHIADLIMPGASFEEMLRVGVERTGYIGHDMDAEEFIRWRIAQHQNPADPYDLQLSDGRWVRVHERRTEDGGIVGIRSDITELKRREQEVSHMGEELKLKNIHFDSALNNMVQGICMFDANQTLVVTNRRYLDMYGFSPDVVKPGITLRQIMEYSVSLGNYTAEEAERAIEARNAWENLRQRTTLKQFLKDGRVIAVMNEPMRNGGTVATYQDITDLERHEEKLHRYTKKLETSNRELQDFAYVASHDLQEPLRKIETFGSRLGEKYAEDLPEAGQKYIERMQDAAGRMRQLINDLLNYSRVSTKAKPFAPTDMNEVLTGVISDLQIRIEERNAEIVAGDLPTIDADSTQMRQLLQNLIGNALKFQKPDVTPRVEVTCEPVEQAESALATPRIRLLIADNGIGFDNKYKAQIFTIFQRLHGRQEYEGTGVGLATCRKIVERHHGELDAEGRPGEGATFIIELPIRQQVETETDYGPAS